MTRKKSIKKYDDVDFEIRFMESLLKKKPDFVEALVVLADLYTKKGFYKEGLVADERLARLKPHDPIVFYNLACSYSLVGDIEKSFKAIKRAVECGYTDFHHLEADGDLSNLRQDKRFQEYLIHVKKSFPKKSKPSHG